MHGITIVVPIYKLGSYRLRNFNFLIKNLSNLNIPILVAEQIGTDQPLLDSKPQSNLYRHKIFTTDIPVIHKSWLVNQAVHHVKTEYVWFIDSDFYTDFASILKCQKFTKFDFFKPFDICKDLNEFQTQQLVKTKCIDESMLRTNMSSDRSIKYFGALSYICKVDNFKNSGQLDENYIGWGYEDLDLFLNIHEQNYSIGVAHNVNAVHMWHLPVINKAKHMLMNKKYFKTKGYTIDRVKRAHQELFESKTVIDY